MSLLLKAGAPPRHAQAARAVQAVKTGKPSSGRRNVAIDVLRGYCIVMMITSHTGTSTYVNNGVHLLRFVSGAEGFVFLAGLVLGMVYRRKLDADSAINAYKTIWRRAGLIWAVHCAAVLLAVSLNTSVFHYEDIPDVRPLGIMSTLWLTASLQLQPGHLLNILPLYVFLLGAAPLAFEMMRRGKTFWLLAASFAIFLYSQWVPGIGRWVHPVSGGDAFPALTWQALFIPGLCIGYYHATLRSKILNPYRKQLLWGLGILCALVLVVVTVQTPTFQFYNHEAWDLYLWERHPLRFGRILYFLLSVGFFYLLAQWWQKRPRLPQFPLTALATLGRNSLYAFLVHIIFAFILGAFQILPERWLLLELIPLATVVGVYLMAHYKVARRWIPN